MSASGQTAYLCATCGVQHAPAAAPPAACPICQDERQYVGRDGQRWTTVAELRKGGRANALVTVEPGLTAVETRPAFAIGQRAVLIETAAGNVMWESVSLADQATIEAIRARGGLAAIALSHPHFHSAVVEFARAFDAPVWVHAADRAWVMRPDRLIRFWDGDEADPLPGSGLRLHRTGGHFPGMAGLLWPAGADGRGVFFGGDMPQVVSDPRWVSFMYSYPNLIPLPAAEVRRIAERLIALPFDRLYGSWPDRCVPAGARDAIARSAERYIDALERVRG